MASHQTSAGVLKDNPGTAVSGIGVDAWRARIRASTFSNYHLEMGLAVEREGNAAAAATHYRLALSHLPELSEASARLVASLRAAGHHAEAEAAHAAALAVDPRYLAYAAVDEALRHAASNEARPFDTAPPESETADLNEMQALRALFWLTEGQDGPAREIMDRTPPLDPRYADRIADQFRHFGGLCMNKGWYPKCYAAYSYAQRIAPVEGDGKLGVSALLSGHLDEAAVALEGAARMSPQNTSTFLYLGTTYQQQGDWSMAEESFRRAISAGAKDAWFALGMTFQFDDRLDEAIAAHQQGLAAFPNHVNGILACAAAHLSKGDVAGTEHYLSVAAAQGAGQDRLCHFRAAFDLHRDQPKPALAAISEALDRVQGTQSPWEPYYHLTRAGILRHCNRHEDALRDFGVATERLPGVPWGPLGTLATLIDLGRMEEAEAAARDLAAYRKLGWAGIQLGRLYRRQGRNDEALAAFRQGLASRPGTGWADFHLGGMAVANGDLAETTEFA